MDKNVDFVLDKFQREFNLRRPKTLIIGVVGSATVSGMHGDIDIFAILGKDGENPNVLISRHEELIKILLTVKSEMKKEGIILDFFTEFRMEEFSRHFSRISSSDNTIPLHLKVYPTLSSIGFWQVRPIARGYFENMNRILYECDNGSQLLKNYISLMPKPESKETLEFLRSLLYETHEYFMLSSLPRDYLLLEAINKLQYIVKYLSIEILNQMDYTSKARISWVSIYEKRFKFSDDLRECIEFIDDVIYRKRSDCAVDIVESYFKKVHTIIDDLC